MSWEHQHQDGAIHMHREDEVCADFPRTQGGNPSVHTAPQSAGVRLVPVKEEPLGGGWTLITAQLPDDVAQKLRQPVEAFDASASVKQAVKDADVAGAAPDPAYSAGRVDFAELLKTDAQWSLKHRFDELLGRPYLSTQLAAMLPADVALRLVQRAENVIQQRVQAQMDQLLNELNRTTEETIDRLKVQADEKRKELNRERFGHPTRLR